MLLVVFGLSETIPGQERRKAPCGWCGRKSMCRSVLFRFEDGSEDRGYCCLRCRTDQETLVWTRQGHYRLNQHKDFVWVEQYEARSRG